MPLMSLMQKILIPKSLMAKSLLAEESSQVELNHESPLTEISEVLEDSSSYSPYLYTGIFAGLALIFYILRAPLTKLITRLLFPRLWRNYEPEAVVLKEKIAHLLTYLFVASFAVLAIGTFPLFDRTSMLFLVGEKVLYTVYALGLLYFIYQVIRAGITHQVERADTAEGLLRKNLVSYLGSLSQGIFWVLALIFILSIWISNLSTLIAGLGIGGLAIALAAQDSLANIFGSLSIMIDHPFEIGDWIETVDFSGTVEHIGLRSTKVRSVDDALIYVPNRTLANAIITNAARRRTRRIVQTIYFKLDSDLTALRDWATEVSSQLDTWEGVIPGSSLAFYDGLNKQAHIMNLRYLTPTAYDEMIAAKETVTYNALELARKYRLELARPLFPDENI